MRIPKETPQEGEVLCYQTYMVVISSAAPIPIVRVPNEYRSGPTWKCIVRAMTRVVRQYGVQRKDRWKPEALPGCPGADSRIWDASNRKSLQRLEAAFNGDPEPFAVFDLWDWEDGEFVLAREATKKEAL